MENCVEDWPQSDDADWSLCRPPCWRSVSSSFRSRKLIGEDDDNKAQYAAIALKVLLDLNPAQRNGSAAQACCERSIDAG